MLVQNKNLIPSVNSGRNDSWCIRTAGQCAKKWHLEQEPAKFSSAPEKSLGEPTSSIKGFNGIYLPFGGGPGICPGRSFAKQEIVCTLAKLALTYDMELQVSKGWEPKMDTAFFPLGSLPPKQKVPFRIRRRS